MKKIAIIGAGLAGLTAGYALKKQNHQVYIFEQDTEVGGVMRSHRQDGYLVEKGPHTILESCTQIRDFLNELGLEKEKLYPDKCAKIRYIAKNNKLIPLPMSPPALLKSKLFSTKGKMRLLCEPFVRKSKKSEEESIAAFIQRRMGQEILDYAINPFIAGTYAGRPEDLSAVHAFSKIYKIEQEHGSLIRGQIKMSKQSKMRPQILSFRNGLQTLPHKLAESIGKENIFLNRKVTCIELNNSKTKISTQQDELEVDKVIYAGTVNGLNNIVVNGTILEEMNSLEKIYYPPIVVLCLGYRREDVSHDLNGFGFLVPEKENAQILGTLFCSSLFSNRTPENHVSLTVFIGGARQPKLAQLTENEIMQMAQKEIKKYLGAKANPHFSYLTKWDNSIPQYTVGYGKYKQVFENIEQKYPNLHLVGNYREGVSITDTIKYSLKIKI